SNSGSSLATSRPGDAASAALASRCVVPWICANPDLLPTSDRTNGCCRQRVFVALAARLLLAPSPLQLVVGSPYDGSPVQPSDRVPSGFANVQSWAHSCPSFSLFPDNSCLQPEPR